MRKTIRKATLCGAVMAGTAMAMAHSADAAIIYLQNFSNTSGNGMQSLGSVNWSVYYGNSSTAAQPALNGPSGNPATAMLSGGASAPTPDGPNVNATASVSSTAYGFVPLLSTDGAQQFVAFSNTSEYTIDRTAYIPTLFSWYAASADSGDTQQLAIEIGGNWYASTNVISPVNPVAGNAISTGSQQYTTTFSTAASAWDTLNFSPGSDLTLGSVLSSPLPSGNITNFGIYATLANHGGGERTYFDTFEVDATPVPEPAEIGALICATALLMLRRKAAS